MRVKVGVVAIILVVATVIGFTFYQIHRWYRQCDEAGGRVEQRFEYATVELTNHYDDKQRLIYVTVDTTRHYSYHCWANRQEVLPSWTS